MSQQSNIGFLTIAGHNGAHVHPMEFTRIDGEWWAATTRHLHQELGLSDGEHVEVLLMDDTDDHVQGVLACSDTPDDRERLWNIQCPEIGCWYLGADDPNLVVLKIKRDA